MASKRRGRGRLSSIDLLPEAAANAVAWAVKELHERKRLQIDIHQEFNGRLADLGIEPVSLSAFNRYSIRKASIARKLDETRMIASAIAEQRGPGEADDLTVLATETLKTVVFEAIELAEGGISSKDAMQHSRALYFAALTRAVSSKHRAEFEPGFKKRIGKAIDAVAKEKGLSDETVRAIKGKILGVGA